MVAVLLREHLAQPLRHSREGAGVAGHLALQGPERIGVAASGVVEALHLPGAAQEARGVKREPAISGMSEED